MRVAVIGTSGSGKSTFARRLAALTGLLHVELDAVNWLPGWRSLVADDPDEFRRRVGQATAAESWISDGNYSTARDLVLGRATDIVWLDHSRALTMRRVIGRSFVRAISGREVWPGTDNREHFGKWLSKEHPIRWAWDTHYQRRCDFAAMIADPALAHAAIHHVRDSRAADALLRELAARAG